MLEGEVVVRTVRYVSGPFLLAFEIEHQVSQIESMVGRFSQHRRSWLERNVDSDVKLFVLSILGMIVGTCVLFSMLFLVIGWLFPIGASAESDIARAGAAEPNAAERSDSDALAETKTDDTFSNALYRDSVGQTLDAIRNARFDFRSDVVTGRFLENFVPLAPLLDDIDERGLSIRRRGRGWLVIEGPYRPLGQRAGSAEMRFVFDESRWKLENVRFHAKRTSP